MAKKLSSKPALEKPAPACPAKPSSLLDTRVIYCGDNLDSSRSCPMPAWIWNTLTRRSIPIATTKSSGRRRSEKRRFDDRHESTKAYIDYMRPRCEQLARVLKKTGSFYYHCDWHASHYVKVMLDQIFGENNFVNEIVWKRSDAKSDSARRNTGAFTTAFFITPTMKIILSTQNLLRSQSTVDHGINTLRKHWPTLQQSRCDRAGWCSERLSRLRMERHHHEHGVTAKRTWNTWKTKGRLFTVKRAWLIKSITWTKCQGVPLETFGGMTLICSRHYQQRRTPWLSNAKTADFLNGLSKRAAMKTTLCLMRFAAAARHSWQRRF